jgi:hypothetical protein
MGSCSQVRNKEKPRATNWLPNGPPGRNARQKTQQAGQLANVAIERIVGIQGVNQATLPDLPVTLHIRAPQISGRIGHLLAAFTGCHHPQIQQFFERVVDQVRVFHVHDEANISQALVTRPVRHMVQHQHVQRRQVFQPGCTHTVRNPAVKCITRHDQAKLKLTHLGAAR